MKRAAGNTTSVIEVLRLNINQFEQAVGRGDDKTAKRCIDAAELMFRGLRDVASGQGCDVGVCPPPSELRPAIPPPDVAKEREVVRPPPIEAPMSLRVRGWSDYSGSVASHPPLGAWLRVKPNGGVVFARLTWAWVCCAAGLTWRVLCWLCRGLRRTP